jgi:hypothetical protein
VLGFPHPDHLLEVLTARQFSDWLNFAAVEPFGPLVDDMRHGALCAAVVGPHLKSGVTAEPRQFMFRPPPEPEMTPEQTVACFRSLLGGKTKKKE